MSDYIDIVIEDDRIYAIDTKTLVRVCIIKSVSDLYRFKEQYGNGVYVPVTYRDHRILADVEELFRGKATDDILGCLSTIYVRFGHLDENLCSLQWINIVTFYRRWCEKAHTKFDDGKLGNICKVLSLSKRDMSAPITRSSPPRLHRALLAPHLSRKINRRN